MMTLLIPQQPILGLTREKDTSPIRFRMTFIPETRTPLTALSVIQTSREDYYAWAWGDALFVVIDPFQYTMKQTFIGIPAGEDSR